MEGFPAPFIVGVPRSGTTLLRMMLDAHPELAVGPETHFLPKMLALSTNPNPLGEVIAEIRGSERWLDFGLSSTDLERAIRGVSPGTLSNAVRAFYKLYASKFAKPRWGDKTPGYLLHMNAIQTILPESRFIHIIRDGRDVALSILPLWFGPNTVKDAALWWQERIAAARRQASALPHYIEVRYEDLLQHPEEVLQRICGFLELDYSPRMLCYPGQARERLEEIEHQLTGPEGRTVSGQTRIGMHLRVLEPPDSAHIGRWRSRMSQQDRNEFHTLAGATLESLGYETPGD